MSNKKNTLKVKIEEHPNKDVLSFHLSKRVPNKSKMQNFIVTADEIDNSLFEEIGKIMESLFEIEGVSDVTISPYEILIEKSVACEWEDIEASVLKVIQEKIAKKDAIEMKPRASMTEEERQEILYRVQSFSFLG